MLSQSHGHDFNNKEIDARKIESVGACRGEEMQNFTIRRTLASMHRPFSFAPRTEGILFS